MPHNERKIIIKRELEKNKEKTRKTTKKSIEPPLLNYCSYCGGVIPEDQNFCELCKSVKDDREIRQLAKYINELHEHEKDGKHKRTERKIRRKLS